MLASQAAVRLSKLTQQHGNFFDREKVAGLFLWRCSRHCKLDVFFRVCVRVLMCRRNEMSMCADSRYGRIDIECCVNWQNRYRLQCDKSECILSVFLPCTRLQTWTQKIRQYSMSRLIEKTMVMFVWMTGLEIRVRDYGIARILSDGLMTFEIPTCVCLVGVCTCTDVGSGGRKQGAARQKPQT